MCNNHHEVYAVSMLLSSLNNMNHSIKEVYKIDYCVHIFFICLDLPINMHYIAIFCDSKVKLFQSCTTKVNTLKKVVQFLLI